jgi:hypothetical protein
MSVAAGPKLHCLMIARHGEDGAFPAPRTLARAGLDLPGVRVSTCGR